MQVLLAILCLALGVSFAWKCIQAVFLGKVTYWSGFLPISLISPLFIHLPPGKNSLIKTTQSWWVHVTAGPIFFLVGLVLIATGADQLGMPGTDSINDILTLGRSDVPPAITFNKQDGYRFPIFVHAGDTVVKLLTQPVMTNEKTYVPSAQSTTNPAKH
jgi:hypothetical protein